MPPDTLAHEIACPGLVWGFDFTPAGPVCVDEIELLRRTPPSGFRWLHFNLADRRTERWLADAGLLDAPLRELLTSGDRRQRVVADGAAAGFVLEDIERDFDEEETRVGIVRFVVTPALMITARLHPLRSGDLVRRRVQAWRGELDAAGALELQFDGMAEVLHDLVGALDDTVQQIEDDFLADRRGSDARRFVALRALMARLRRLMGGARGVLHQVEADPGFPPALSAPCVRALHRLATLDGELMAVQAQLRLLREELDLQAAQRTNQNLYILSILTALMLPATLVTGVFGMNTGGLPLAGNRAGAGIAVLLAVAASAAVYVALRLMGFMRR